jgi:hypothetical protein
MLVEHREVIEDPIIGRSDMIVASSWIDMLAGLSGEYILRIPPDFCADADAAATSVNNSAPAVPNARILRFTLHLPDALMCAGCAEWRTRLLRPRFSFLRLSFKVPITGSLLEIRSEEHRHGNHLRSAPRPAD